VFGLLSQRYRLQYGVEDEALAKLAVTQRNHAFDESERLRRS